MSHFYGGIEGNRGPATRMGSKDSGFRAYAQGYGARVTVAFTHTDRPEWLEGGDEPHDVAYVNLTGGYSSYSRGGTLRFEHIDAIVSALDDDEQCKRIFKRIQDEIRKLDARAVKVEKVRARKYAAERKRRDRELRRQQREQRAA